MKIKNNLTEEGKFSITISEKYFSDNICYHISGLDKPVKNLLEAIFDRLELDYETRYLVKKKEY